jgi:hypothetical protein
MPDEFKNPIVLIIVGAFLVVLAYQTWCPASTACRKRGGDYTLFDGCTKTITKIIPV